MTRWLLVSWLGSSACFFAGVGADAQDAATARVQLSRDDAAGQLAIAVDGREAVVYQHAPHQDMAHFYPVRSPSGKLLTIQQTEPYPHHRSLWFADKVQLAGQRAVSFYNALSTRADRNDPRSPCRDRIRHVEFLDSQVAGNTARIGMRLVWEMDFDKPVLDERRQVRIVALENGDYLLDLQFTLTAAHGDVSFLSDAVHYAWPFARLHPQFSVDQGGTLTNSEGGVNQPGTHGQPALWIDYSNTVAGQTEGLAMFSHPDNGPPPKWLTRDYGTCGPRRSDDRSGKPFVIQREQSLHCRAGVLVHSGDARSGRVAERYADYAAGAL